MKGYRQILTSKAGAIICAIVCAVIFFTLPALANAETCTSKTSGNWNLASTWDCDVSGEKVPATGDDVIVAAVDNVTLNCTLGSSCDSPANVTVEGTLTQATNTQQVIIGNLTVEGTLTHTDNTSLQSYRIDFSAVDVNIASTGVIDADYKGYQGGSGGGDGYGTGRGVHVGREGSGGGHGGYGGDAWSWDQSASGGVSYCDINDPATIGSGGGSGNSSSPGGDGGGLIRLNASGTVTIDGAIEARGGDGGQSSSYNGGGGGGGAVKIVADTITCTSSCSGTKIFINGGNGNNYSSDFNSGGGGGGCAYIQYTTNNGITVDNVSMAGGTGGYYGGAGVLYIKPGSGSNGALYAVNSLVSGHGNPISTQYSSSVQADTLTVKNGAIYRVPSGKSLTLDAQNPFAGSVSSSSIPSIIRIDNGATFTAYQHASNDFMIDDAILELHQSATFTSASSKNVSIEDGGIFDLRDFSTTNALSLNKLTVKSGGILTHGANSTVQSHIVNISSPTITIDSGGSIDVSERGYSGGVYNVNYGNGLGAGGGPGYGVRYDRDGSGAGHKGKGGDGWSWSANSLGGDAYCDVSNPATIGSGGGSGGNYEDAHGGGGGGLIILNSSGTITVNGTIEADGENYGRYGTTSYIGGGGAGGGIKIVADTIAGTPTAISVRGGNGLNYSSDFNSGGGGGGCVFMQYTTGNSIDYTDVTMYGGSGGMHGGAGVLFIRQGSGTGGDLYSVNNGTEGGITPQIADPIVADSLTVRNRAIYSLTSGKDLTLNNASPFNESTNTSIVRIDDGSIFAPYIHATNDFVVDNVILEIHQSATVTSLDDLNIEIADNGTLELHDFSTANAFSVKKMTIAGLLTHGENTTSQSHVVNVEAPIIDLQGGGEINVAGRGYSGGVYGTNGANGYGTGNGLNGGRTGSGGGHAGAGGSSYAWGDSASGGATYCTLDDPGTIGSGGGGGSNWTDANGGDGGGLVILNSTGDVTLAGLISADGDSGNRHATTDYSGGGGSGGAVKVIGDSVTFSGSISAQGGDAYYHSANSYSGCGGGGCVYFNYTSFNDTGSSVDVTSCNNTSIDGDDGEYNLDPQNSAPVADAGTAQTNIAEGATITLSGSCTDSDAGDTLTGTWSQTGGTSCGTISGTPDSGASVLSAVATCTAPSISSDETITFQLLCSDTEVTDADTVTVDINAAPNIDAGTHGSAVSEDGDLALGSIDIPPSSSDTDIETFLWNEISSCGIGFSSTTVLQPTLTIPNLSSNCSANLRLTVNDGVNSAVTDNLTFTISAGDAAPTVANPISDVSVDEDSLDTTIDLTTLFTDLDNDDSAITKSVLSNTNSTLVDASIAGNTLTLDYQDDQNGTSTVTIRGTSNGQTVDDSFDVTVASIDDDPTVANPISNVVVNEDADDTTVDLTNVFTDIDNEDSSITKAVHANSNSTLVTASIVGNTLTLDYQDEESGGATITVRATSNGKTVDDFFDVTVNSFDDPPTVANPIGDVSVDEDADDTLIDLTSVFTDVDNEDSSITKSVLSNTNSGLVAASIVGNTLTLDYQPGESGTATITVRGTSNGKTVDDSFIVDVGAVDDPPTVANPIGDVGVDEDADDTLIDLTSVFTDVDNEDSSITKSVLSNTNSGLVTASIVGNTLTLDYQDDQYGSATITVRGTSNGKTVDDEFDVSVAAVDDGPVIANPISNVVVDEDADDTLIDLTSVFTDIDNEDSSITKAVHANSNSSLVTASIVGNTLTLDYQDEESGGATITIRATSNGKTVDDFFDVTVNSFDDPPTVANAISNVSVSEDASNTTIDLADVFTDVDNDDASITKAIQSNSNSGLVSASIVGNTLTLDYQDDQNGSATVTVRATSNGKTVDDLFDITVIAVDDDPVVAIPISDVSVAEDAGDSTINLSSVFTDIDNDDTSITKAVHSNSNTGLVAASIVGNTLTLDYQDDESGSATIIVRATSNTKTVDDSFDVTVSAEDDAPAVANAIADVNVDEDADDTTIDLTDVFTDVDNDDALITKSIQSNSNETLVAATIVGNTLTLDYQDDRFGSAFINVRATSNGKNVNDQFVVTVSAIDDAPTVANPIADVSVDEDADDTSISLEAVFTDIDDDDLSITKVIHNNSNDTLVQASIVGENIILDYQDDRNGSATITVRATSNGKTVDDEFDVSIAAVDDDPTVANAISDVSVDEDASDTTIDLTSVFTDVDNDDSLITKAVLSNTNSSLVSASIVGNTLTLDYQDDQNGVATVTIRATSNGKSVDDIFDITVNAVDDDPTIANAIADVSVAEDAADTTIDLTSVFTDIDNDDALITKAVLSNTNGSLLSASAVGNTLTLDYHDNQNGSATITIRGTSNGKTVDDDFLVTVSASDDAPTVANPIADVSVNEDAPNTTIDLTSVFTDIDNDDAGIIKSVAGNSNGTLLTANIASNTLTLDYADNQSGTATITIRGTSNGKTVDDIFLVTVSGTNDDPEAEDAYVGDDDAQYAGDEPDGIAQNVIGLASLTPKFSVEYNDPDADPGVAFCIEVYPYIEPCEDCVIGPQTPLWVSDGDDCNSGTDFADVGLSDVASGGRTDDIIYGLAGTAAATPLEWCTAYDISIKIMDDGGAWTSAASTMYRTDCEPELSGLENVTVAEGGTVTINFTGSDPDANVHDSEIPILSCASSDLTAAGVSMNEIFTDNGNGTGTIDLSDIGSQSINLPSEIDFNIGYNMAGVYEVTCTATDDDSGLSVSGDFTLTITETNRAPSWNEDYSDQEWEPGIEGGLTVAATDPDGDDVTYSATNLPSGATIDSETGEIIWLPTEDQEGEYTITLVASDGVDASTQVVKIVVIESIYADAGDDQLVPGGTQVILDATGGTVTPNASLIKKVGVRQVRGSRGVGELVYQWTQVGGGEMIVWGVDKETPTATFTAPNENVVMRFRLTVWDERNRTDTDDVRINIYKKTARAEEMPKVSGRVVASQCDTLIVEEENANTGERNLKIGLDDSAQRITCLPDDDEVVVKTYREKVYVGDPSYSEERGAVWMVPKERDYCLGDDDEEVALFEGSRVNDRLGEDISVRDLDGDGDRELCASVPGSDRLDLVHMDTELEREYAMQKLSEVRGVKMENTRITGGDFNSDGKEDIIMYRDLGVEEEELEARLAYIAFGTDYLHENRRMPDDADLEIMARSPISDVSVGDVDGDGVEDVAISSVADCAVYIFSGQETIARKVAEYENRITRAWISTDDADRRIDCDELSEDFGYKTVVRDISGDGLADVIVGAPRASDLRGKVRTYFGRENLNRMAEADLVIEGSSEGSELGRRISGGDDDVDEADCSPEYEADTFKSAYAYDAATGDSIIIDIGVMLPDEEDIPDSYLRIKSSMGCGLISNSHWKSAVAFFFILLIIIVAGYKAYRKIK